MEMHFGPSLYVWVNPQGPHQRARTWGDDPNRCFWAPTNWGLKPEREHYAYDAKVVQSQDPKSTNSPPTQIDPRWIHTRFDLPDSWVTWQLGCPGLSTSMGLAERSHASSGRPTIGHVSRYLTAAGHADDDRNSFQNSPKSTLSLENALLTGIDCLSFMP